MADRPGQDCARDCYLGISVTTETAQKATGDRMHDDRALCRGYICALAALALWDQDTIFDNIVKAYGNPEALIDQARRDRAMRWSGLSGYLQRRA